MEESIEKIVVTYSWVPESNHASNCTFCGRSGMASNYVAGLYVVQICEQCAENPPGAVKEKPEVVEEKSGFKKKKK